MKYYGVYWISEPGATPQLCECDGDGACYEAHRIEADAETMAISLNAEALGRSWTSRYVVQTIPAGQLVWDSSSGVYAKAA